MEYKHFSHPHNLILHRVEPGQQYLCHGCNLPCRNDSIYACWSCKFFIHQHCGNANRFVKHPSHSAHPLILVPSPTYCSGSFLCNACGAPGSAFSYCCALCEVDLHVNCAYLPQKVSHNAHRHELYLSFAANNNSDHCKMCRKELNSRNWSYLCEVPGCEFRVHTSCGTDEVRPGQYRDDDQSEGGIPAAGGDQTREELTPEEVMLEIGRMNMELQMTHALGNIIAYFPH